MSDWVVTDVKPHVMLCPLPDGYWWVVEFLMRLDSCHMHLNHGRWWNPVTQIGDTHVVLNVSEKSVDDIAKSLIDGSYDVWQKWFRRVDSRQQEWIATAREVEHQLQRKGPAKAKFKIDRAP